MSSTPDPSRRRALKYFAGLPLLPLASAPALAALTAGGHAAPANMSSVRFIGMAAPTLADAASMATISVASSLQATYSDGSIRSFALAYRPLFVTGDLLSDGKGGSVVAGGCFDSANRAILDTTDGQRRQIFSDCPDGMTLLDPIRATRVAGVKGNALFAVVQFEYTSRNLAGASMYGRLPSPIAVLTLNQDKSSGELTMVKYHNVDTSAVHGLWLTCAASRSPWNTHLSSEEYEPDATKVGNPLLRSFSQSLFGDPDKANPYHYGHLPEVSVNPDGTGSIKKHYCLGRISREVVQVMPDERTVLMGDDTSNGGLFMFVADKARDLGAGSLYVAKWKQTSSANGGSASLDWIKLGSASSAEIEALADRLKAADIVDVKTSDPLEAGYVKIPFGGKFNWVRFVAGKEQAAAFLETHRYAAFKGGSLGFTKMEGVAVDAKDRIAYAAISYIRQEMRDGSGGISVQGPRAGAVYALKLEGGQKDDRGAVIDSAWVAVDMAALPALTGEDLATPDALGNTANADRIANPDNLKFSEKLRTLFVGEDSGMHVNNFLWAYDVDSKQLSRILSCPAGAESTGLHVADDINGFSYIMSNFQHAGDWERPLHDKVKAALDPLVRANYKNGFGAAVGYLSGLPKLR